MLLQGGWGIWHFLGQFQFKKKYHLRLFFVPWVVAYFPLLLCCFVHVELRVLYMGGYVAPFGHDADAASCCMCLQSQLNYNCSRLFLATQI
jgi:hypothetical protein